MKAYILPITTLITRSHNDRMTRSSSSKFPRWTIRNDLIEGDGKRQPKLRQIRLVLREYNRLRDENQRWRSCRSNQRLGKPTTRGRQQGVTGTQIERYETGTPKLSWESFKIVVAEDFNFRISIDNYSIPTVHTCLWTDSRKISKANTSSGATKETVDWMSMEKKLIK